MKWHAVAFGLIIDRGDPPRCRYCDVEVQHRWDPGHEHGNAARSRCAHIDHLTPVSRGGSGDLTNLALACGPCNLDKGPLTEAEYQLKRSRYCTADDLATVREDGRRQREEALLRAPADPCRRIAWMRGHEEGCVAALDGIVTAARSTAVTWREIAEALDENHNTVRVRYTQPDRTHR